MNEFDVKAKGWDAQPERRERAEAVAKEIRRKTPLRPAMTAFEYGCGTGLLSFALQPFFARIVAADSSDGMLSVLKEKIAASGVANLSTLKLDLSRDDPPQEPFDVVYTLLTLHHIRDVDQILRDFHGLLKATGYLCVADLDAEDGSFHDDGFNGHKGFDRAALQRQAENVGFRNVRFSTVYRIRRKTEDSERTFTLFLMVAEKTDLL